MPVEQGDRLLTSVKTDACDTFRQHVDPNFGPSLSLLITVIIMENNAHKRLSMGVRSMGRQAATSSCEALFSVAIGRFGWVPAGSIPPCQPATGASASTAK
jgi:hypothetical protein